jgi:hypothetical protein
MIMQSLSLPWLRSAVRTSMPLWPWKICDSTLTCWRYNEMTPSWSSRTPFLSSVSTICRTISASTSFCTRSPTRESGAGRSSVSTKTALHLTTKSQFSVLNKNHQSLLFRHEFLHPTTRRMAGRNARVEGVQERSVRQNQTLARYFLRATSEPVSVNQLVR